MKIENGTHAMDIIVKIRIIEKQIQNLLEKDNKEYQFSFSHIEFKANRHANFVDPIKIAEVFDGEEIRQTAIKKLQEKRKILIKEFEELE